MSYLVCLYYPYFLSQIPLTSAFVKTKDSPKKENQGSIHPFTLSKMRKNIYRSNIELLLKLTIISDVYRSFTWNKTIFTMYCLTQWISKALRSFGIHWLRQYLENFMGLVGIVNATVSRLSQFSQVLGMANYPSFKHCIHTEIKYIFFHTFPQLTDTYQLIGS